MSAIWLGRAEWQKRHRVVINSSLPFRTRLIARPRMRPGLSAIETELEVSEGQPGTFVFRLQRVQLGTTGNAYVWDWQAGQYPANEFSFVDLSKLVREDGVVTAWDVDVARGGALRLKIWRPEAEKWRVVAQSDLETARPGLNHFALSAPLKVQRGDYLGLYTAAGGLKLSSPAKLISMADLKNQHEINLALSMRRGMQYDFPGDVACGLKSDASPAPNPGYSFSVFLSSTLSGSGKEALNGAESAIGSLAGKGVPGLSPPISLIDLDKVVRERGTLQAWEVLAGQPGTMQLKLWRREGPNWHVVGESIVERVKAGFNRFRLALPIESGDVLGFSSLATPVVLYNLSDGCGEPSRGQLYLLNADARGVVADSALTHDPHNGNYSFRVLYTPTTIHAAPGGEPATLAATVQLKPGRRLYNLRLPDQAFALDEQVEFSIEAKGSAKGFIYPSLTDRVTGQTLVSPEYESTTTTPAPVITEGPPKRPIATVLLIVLTIVGSSVLLRPARTAWPLALGALPIAAAWLIFRSFAVGLPVGQLLPVLVATLLIPGFVLLELAFYELATRLDTLERIPLIFGLSIALWVGFAALVYRAQWSTDGVIGGLFIFDLIGLAAVFISRYRIGICEAGDGERMLGRWSALTFGTAISVISGLVTYCSQFQMSDYDVMFHLAGFRNVADGARIVSGDNVLGSNALSIPQYTASPWYLVGGLAARAAHADVTWLFVVLTFFLTILAFLSFYFGLTTLLANKSLAIAGILIGTMSWLSGLAVSWRMFWSLYLTFLPFANEVAELILLPLVIFCCLRYIKSRMSKYGLLAVLMAAATMGIHVEYIVHVPYVAVMVLLASMIPRQTPQHRVQTLIIAIAIGIAAFGIAYLGLSFPTRAPLPAPTEEEALSIWLGVWRLSPHLYSANPAEYFLDAGWKAVLALLVVTLSIRFRIVLLMRKRIRGWRAAILFVRRKASSRFVVATITAVVAPWVLAFNPFVVPLLVRLLHSTVPFYRMVGSTGTFLRVVEFGAIACMLSWLLTRHFIRSQMLRAFVLGAIVLGGLMLPFVSPANGEAITGAVNDYGWYPSLLDLPNEALYRGLNRLQPGAVAVRPEEALMTAALTPLDPIFVEGDRIGDYRLSAERRIANEQILHFTVSPAEMRTLLNRYHCSYVIVQVGSPSLPRFRSEPDLFVETLRAETNVVFTVQRKFPI